MVNSAFSNFSDLNSRIFVKTTINSIEIMQATVPYKDFLLLNNFTVPNLVPIIAKIYIKKKKFTCKAIPNA